MLRDSDVQYFKKLESLKASDLRLRFAFGVIFISFGLLCSVLFICMDFSNRLNEQVLFLTMIISFLMGISGLTTYRHFTATKRLWVEYLNNLNPNPKN